MRVPGNERAFTVSPAPGIPFPQLVCIGGGRRPITGLSGINQGRGSLPPAPGIGPRAPAAARYCTQPGRGDWGGRGHPRAPRAPARPRVHTHQLTRGLQAPPGCGPRAGSNARGCAAAYPRGGSAQRRPRRPRSGARRRRRRRRPSPPGEDPSRELRRGREISWREAPRASRRRNCCREGSRKAARSLRLSPTLRTAHGRATASRVGWIRPPGGQRAGPRWGAALRAPRPGRPVQRSGADSLNKTRRCSPT